MSYNAFCPNCNKYVEYYIRKGIIAKFKDIDVNVVENVAVCVDCNRDIYVSELESKNFNKLYSRFEELGGVVEKILRKDKELNQTSVN